MGSAYQASKAALWTRPSVPAVASSPMMNVRTFGLQDRVPSVEQLIACAARLSATRAAVARSARKSNGQVNGRGREMNGDGRSVEVFGRSLAC